MTFPAFSRLGDNNRREFVRLTQSDGEGPEIPLAPVQVWSEDLQQFSSLFPWSRTLSDDFFKELPDADAWRMLEEKGFVRTNIVISNNGNVNFRESPPDEALADGEHTTADPVAMTDIAFLAKDRIGIMTRIRGSQSRAQLFWRFLTEWLVIHDSERPRSKKSKMRVWRISQLLSGSVAETSGWQQLDSS